MKNGVLFFWAIILSIIVLGVGASFFVGSGPSQHDTLAQCIKSNGIIFYGAFWCPHCQRTKALFGSATRYLPYVECSTSDGNGQTQECLDKKITTYPTWIRPDGGQLTGEHTLEEWASFSGCTLDGQKTAFSAITSATSSEATKVR